MKNFSKRLFPFGKLFSYSGYPKNRCQAWYSNVQSSEWSVNWIVSEYLNQLSLIWMAPKITYIFTSQMTATGKFIEYSMCNEILRAILRVMKYYVFNKRPLLWYPLYSSLIQTVDFWLIEEKLNLKFHCYCKVQILAIWLDLQLKSNLEQLGSVQRKVIDK